MFIRRVLPAFAAALGLAACSTPSSGPGPHAAGAEGTLDVVVALYPIEFLATTVGGDAITVTDLTPTGTEPHDIELTPRQVAAIANADLIVYLSGFQPAIDDAVATNPPAHVLDLADHVHLHGPLVASLNEVADDHAEDDHGEDEHGAVDPHFWLDPERMIDAGVAIAAAIAEISPDAAAETDAGLTALTTDMQTLLTTGDTTLATCATRDFVTTHTAFSYFAERFDLRQLGISGIDPEAEPSPSRVQQVSETIKSNHITTIYFETLLDPKIATTLAADLGISTAVLDPIEAIVAPGTDYVSVMNANFDALATGLQCQP